MCPHCNFLVSFSHRSGHVWILSFDKTVMTKHQLSASPPEKKSRAASVTSVFLPDIENHYNWEQRWRKCCQNCVQTEVACRNKGCCINLNFTSVWSAPKKCWESKSFEYRGGLGNMLPLLPSERCLLHCRKLTLNSNHKFSVGMFSGNLTLTSSI